MTESTNKIFEKIESEFEDMKSNHTDFAEKGNKAAGRRARKAASNLKKLMVPYRKTSVDESKEL